MKPKLEQVATKDISPYLDNPRVHPESQVKQLVASIREFGFTVPILLDSDDEVIAGHGRLLAATVLGLKIVPVIRLANLTPDQVRAYRIADNRLTDLGGWDNKALFEELEKLDMADFDMELTGFSGEEFARMKPPDPDAEETPDPPSKPVTKPGDLWVLGRHRLVCGDSSDKKAVELALGGAHPNLMVTDPPYGVNYDPNWRSEAAARGELSYAPQRTGTVINDDSFEWGATLRRYLVKVAYVWSPGGDHQIHFARIIQEAGYGIRSQLIWRKQSLVISRGHYHWIHEPCWYAVRKGATSQWIGDRSQSTVWDINWDKNVEGGHSTQKPVECMERPIRNHSGDVYDPFVGSGTTLIAAERQERQCYAIEIDPAYCDVVVQRWENYTGGKAKKAETG